MNNSSNQTMTIKLRFFGDLDDLVYSNYTGPELERTLYKRTSVKDLIED